MTTPHFLTTPPNTHTHAQITVSSSPTFQLQYLQVASFAHNKITSTEGIAHPMLENLNLSCKSCAFNIDHVLHSSPSPCPGFHIV